MNTFYFYDLETFGIDPKTARIAQFGGIRTDEDFNIIAEPDMFYCQPTGDSLPDPQACILTGITPQLCQKEGLPEHKFIQKILNEFSKRNTCVIGYNNIRFDDEFIRFCAWRNLLEPYAWSWQNGNSRFDLIDVVRFCYALKPNNSLKWAYDEDNKPSFKLDKLSLANNIEHKNAHDALADVMATVEIAKKIKKTQAQLFSYALSLKNKKAVASKVKLLQPMLHTSGMYSATDSCTKLIAALAYHPQYQDRVIVYDLAQDVNILLNLSANELQQRLFVKQDELPKGVDRLNIKEMVFNKSPMFIASEKPPKNLNIDTKLCLSNLAIIKENHGKILAKILEIYKQQDFNNTTKDVEQMLYGYDFIGNKDRKILNDIVQQNDKQLKDTKLEFTDNRLDKLLLHYKAKNYPKSLTNKEQEYWFETIQERIQLGCDGYLAIDKYFAIIEALTQNYPDKLPILQELNDYGSSLI